jgi:hypothetical protein
MCIVCATLLAATLIVPALVEPRLTVPVPPVSRTRELEDPACKVKLPVEDTVPEAPPKVKAVELKVLVLYVPETTRLSLMVTVEEVTLKYLVAPPLLWTVNRSAPMAELASWTTRPPLAEESVIWGEDVELL